METEALKLTLKRELWKTKKHVILELKLNLGTKTVWVGFYSTAPPRSVDKKTLILEKKTNRSEKSSEKSPESGEIWRSKVISCQLYGLLLFDTYDDVSFS